MKNKQLNIVTSFINLFTKAPINTEKGLDFKGIVERLVLAFDLKNASALARNIGVKENNPSMWKKRGGLPYEKLFLNLRHINLNWLIYGDGQIASGYIPELELQIISETGQRLHDFILEKFETISNFADIENIELRYIYSVINSRTVPSNDFLKTLEKYGRSREWFRTGNDKDKAVKGLEKEFTLTQSELNAIVNQVLTQLSENQKKD